MPSLTKLTATLALMLGVAFSATKADAAQGGNYPGPLGGSDMRSAYNPPVGIYYGFATMQMWPNHYTGENGDDVPGIDWHGRSSIIANVIGVTWPFQLFGGSFYSQANLYTMDLSADVNGIENLGDVEGTGAPYFELIRYSKYLGLMGAKPGALKLPYGLVMNAGLAMQTPWGDYDSNKLMNLGSANVYTFIPNFALTYLTGPDLSFGDATEFSGRVYYNTGNENNVTGYQNGDSVNFDWGLSQRFGRYQVGLAGNVAKQIEDDTKYGVKVGLSGNRLFNYTIGASAVVDVPEWKTSFKTKLMFQPYSENKVSSDVSLFFSMGVKLD